jgi:hypothetical protein
VQVKLKLGAYRTPVATGRSVVVMETTESQLHTFTHNGAARGAVRVPDPADDVRIKRSGDGRIYVDNTNGTHTLVVDTDGRISDVDSTKAIEHKPSPTPPQQQPNTVPSAPRSVRALPGNAQVTVSWGAAQPNGSPLTSYEVSWRASNSGQPGQRTLSPNQRTLTLSQLTNGARYTFSVAARNALGAGPAATAPPVTPSSDVPSPPASVAAAANASGAVTLTWPLANGQGNTITQYQVTATGADGSTLQAGPTQGLSLTVNRGAGLSLGVSYTFTVVSTNNLGLNSEPSPASNAVIPYAAAAAPGNLAVAGRDGSIDVAWTAPNLNGGQLVDYVVTGAGLPQQVVTITSVRFTGLANGTEYRVEVRARTRGRTGGEQVDGAQASAAGRPGTVPLVTLNSVASAGDRAGVVRVSVDERASGPVQCLLIFNGASRWSGACGGNQDITIGGLEYATNYNVQVQPSNAYGNGPVSGILGFRTNDPPPPPRITVSRGAAHNTPTCTGGGCAWVNVTGENLSANTAYSVVCRASNGDEGGWWTLSRTTDGAGRFSVINSGCVYGYSNRTVWATAGPHESNRMVW